VALLCSKNDVNSASRSPIVMATDPKQVNKVLANHLIRYVSSISTVINT
jgi:hypothetical protein